MCSQRILGIGLALALSFTLASTYAADQIPSGTAGSGVQIKQLNDRLRVEINGRLFTEYFYKDVPRPYCYPLIGPGEVAMTRNLARQQGATLKDASLAAAAPATAAAGGAR